MNSKWLVLILWFAITGFNINKAFHIDDAFHLEAAKWIAKNPLKPMSGLINWTDNPEPMFTSNQPPLFFYLIAVVGELFGYSEVPMHLLESVFAFLALWFFYKVCTIISPSKGGLLLVFLAFCPAMIVNQNLMLDIPLLSLELAFIYYLIKNTTRENAGNYVQALLFLSAALLMKYSILPLLGVFFVSVLYEKKYKYLFLGLIPLMVLGLWSLTNFLEFQKIHLLNRPINHSSLLELGKRCVGFIACIGAVSPFSIALYFGKFPYKIVERITIAILTAMVVFCLLAYIKIIPQRTASDILNLSFLVNGLGVLLICASEVMSKCRADGTWKWPEKQDVVLLTSFIFLAAFTIKYAPFIATRHVLLVIPSILLICGKLVNHLSQKIKILSIAFSLALGSLLAISDWEYANFYREIASMVSVPKGSNVWVSGHWGWQWYSKNIASGRTRQYGTDSSIVKKGDYFINPHVAVKPQLNKKIVLQEVRKIWIEPRFSTFFSVSQNASMYFSSYNKGPWNLCRCPVDTIVVSKVVIGNPF